MRHEARSGPLGYGDLFWLFLQAGLAFGGGLGILAVLERELVVKRHAVSQEEFLAIYGLGRVVPSGTMTALAVAYGARFGGLPGTVVALTALILPAFALTVLLAAAYAYVERGPLLPLLPVTILPAALAFIVAAGLSLAKSIARPSIEPLLVGAAGGGVLVLHLNPALLLLLGAAIGAVVFARTEETAP